MTCAWTDGRRNYRNRIKRFMGRKGILLAVALTALLAAGCGGKKEPVKTSEAETSAPAETGTRAESGTATQELPNPMAEVKDVLAFEAIGVHMVLPEGAEDTSFFIINQEVADARFSLDGVAYTYRASDTAEDFAGIFERFKDEAISRNYDYGETSLEVLIKTTDSGGRLASWEWGSTKYTLYTAAQVDDDTITDLTMHLVELSQYEK